MRKLVPGIMAAALFFMGWAAPLSAAPAAPAPAFPADRDIISDKTPALDWSDVAGSTYTVQVATAADFATVTVSSAAIYFSSYTLAGAEELARGSTYYWRVRASDATGDSVFSSTFSFTVTQNRISYTLELDTTTPLALPLNFSRFLKSVDLISSTTNQYQTLMPESLLDATTYYWRVRAVDEGGNIGPYCTDTKFVTANPLAAPILGPPANGKRLLSGVPLLDWTDVAGSSYTLYVSTSLDFQPLKISSAAITLSRYQVKTADALADLTTYYWRVRALAGSDVSISSVSMFYINTISTAALMFPADRDIIADKTPTLQWSIPASLTDILFTAEWSVNQNMSGAASASGLTTGYYTLGGGEALTRGSTYYWRVKTMDDAGTTLTSSTFSFTVTQNRISYTLELDLTTPLTDPLTLSKLIKSGDLITTTTNQYQVSGAESLSGGTTYYWRVRARDEGGNTGSYCADTMFRIPGGWFNPVWVSSLTVNWDSTSPPDTVYYTKLSTASNFTGAVLSSDTVNLWATFQNLTPNTTYFAAGAPSAGASTATYILFGSVSTLALPVSGEQIYRVFYTSVTFNWLPRPVSPSSTTCEGYKVELSTAADFTGAVFSSVTVNVNLSTLTVIGLGCGVEYYARLGSRNWGGLANYNIAGSTETQTWDCGLRFFDGTQNVINACEYPGVMTSRFRIFNKGINFGVILIDPAKPKASRWRIMTPEGIRAVRKYP
ncbi:MAG: hypothetical protein A2X28_10830 [Elusimicrobia bacterium GWA2_56_46]|nr:MAG: hypothetical protein A2X28_10830 [Elusimicrobia bacterium GWA2_56_46]OGR55759.1 MAG: hypothetical protein A2X39_10450 [Elusimicrobia bacterium GWC2_56_31]